MLVPDDSYFLVQTNNILATYLTNTYLSSLIPHSSFLISHLSFLIPYLLPLTSYLLPLTSYLLPLFYDDPYNDRCTKKCTNCINWQCISWNLGNDITD